VLEGADTTALCPIRKMNITIGSQSCG